MLCFPGRGSGGVLQVSADSNAYYIVNCANEATLHFDGNGDKLVSTRYGDVRDGYAQWTFEEVAGY